MDLTASDAVMRSGAAPSYFPSFQNYIDGGMFAHARKCKLTRTRTHTRAHAHAHARTHACAHEHAHAFLHPYAVLVIVRNHSFGAVTRAMSRLGKKIKHITVLSIGTGRVCVRVFLRARVCACMYMRGYVVNECVC